MGLWALYVTSRVCAIHLIPEDPTLQRQAHRGWAGEMQLVLIAPEV